MIEEFPQGKWVSNRKPDKTRDTFQVFPGYMSEATKDIGRRLPVSGSGLSSSVSHTPHTRGATTQESQQDNLQYGPFGNERWQLMLALQCRWQLRQSTQRWRCLCGGLQLSRAHLLWACEQTETFRLLEEPLHPYAL